MHLKTKHFQDINNKYSHVYSNLQFCVKNKIVNGRVVYILSKSREFIFSFLSLRLFIFNNLSADIFDSSINYNNIVSYFTSISSKHSQ